MNKKILIGLIVLVTLFTGLRVAFGDSYGYGAYGGVNSVVMPMMYKAATDNLNKTPETPVPSIEKPDEPLVYREFITGDSYRTIRKFVDPDNGNVCYLLLTKNSNSISCVK